MEQDTVTISGRTFKRPKFTAYVLDKIRKRFDVKGLDSMGNEFFKSLANDFEKMCEFFATILEETGKQPGEVSIDELKNFFYREVDVREMSEKLTDFFGSFNKKLPPGQK